jgi:hypothetical protein
MTLSLVSTLIWVWFTAACITFVTPKTLGIKSDPNQRRLMMFAMPWWACISLTKEEPTFMFIASLHPCTHSQMQFLVKRIDQNSALRYTCMLICVSATSGPGNELQPPVAAEHDSHPFGNWLGSINSIKSTGSKLNHTTIAVVAGRATGIPRGCQKCRFFRL